MPSVQSIQCRFAEPWIPDAKQLSLAARLGNRDCVEGLIALRADPRSLFGPERKAPLHDAAAEGHQEVCEALLRYVPIGLTSGDGSTALHFAARGGHLDVINLLLRQGADPNIRNKDGVTACEVASACGHHSIARNLLNETTSLNEESKLRIGRSIESAEVAKVHHVGTALLMGGALLGTAIFWFNYRTDILRNCFQKKLIL
ncbi:MAG: ankyrin repeat domain-containing protein [Verrucomicrobia bacterium]|nr:ankyrin repeat domain-containing protein [Verrucomicrobiota bacterium]